MRKVGILTFYNNYNYGSYLQAFALIKQIDKLGYESFLIDFCDSSKPWNRRVRWRTIINRIICALGHPALFFETMKSRRIGYEQKQCSKVQKIKFDDFLNRELNIYKDDYTKSDFLAFVTGSDQVWKLSLPGLHYVFFQRFAKQKQRISYAASIGTDRIPPYNRRVLKKYLKGFTSISLREKNAVTLLSNLDDNINPEFVLDPVLLVGRKFWEEIIPAVNKLDYVLLYFLDIPKDNFEAIKSMLTRFQDRKVIMVNTGIKPLLIQNCELIDPSPLEFVSFIKNASLILTDSFHGSAFSILFDKEFLTFSRQYKIYSGQKDRIFSLLDLFKCKDRYIDDVNYINKDIKPVSFAEILSNMRAKSLSYLEHALNKAGKSDEL